MPRNGSGRPRPKAQAAKPAKRGPRGPLRLSQRRDPTKVVNAASGVGPANRTFVLFGADEYCKPRAARFSAADPSPLAKAAEVMSLCLVEVKTPDIAALAKKLPTGQLFADGRGLVPFVKSDIYEELVFEAVGRD